MFEFLVDTARTVSDLVLSGALQRHQGIQWVFTHGGGILPLLADRFELFRTGFSDHPSGPSVHEQLSSLWFDLAGTPFPRQVPALVDVVGSRQLLYGSDSCWTPAPLVEAQVAHVDGAPQPEGTAWRELTTRNAERLFATDPAGREA